MADLPTAAEIHGVGEPPSIEELTMLLVQQEARIVALEKLFQLQSQINGKLLTELTHRQTEEMDAKKQSGLILPDRMN